MSTPFLSRMIVRPLLRNKFVQIILFVLLAYALLNPQFWQEPTMSVSKYDVIDGDSLRYHDAHNPRGHQEIRLWGIDAVELRQPCYQGKRMIPCGEIAKEHLSHFVANHDLQCRHKDTDQYGRLVMQCFKGEDDLAAWMVGQGWALDYRQHSHGHYRSDEEQARQNKLGIWAYTFDKPYEWRRKNKRP
jgi:endonuclease YncB( thermonuclease family)